MNHDPLLARLAEKRAALAKSDAAINTLTDLIVAAANGEAVAENGARLSTSDVVRSADSLRQIHATLTAEVEALERRVANEKRRLEYEASPTAKRMAALTARI